MSIIKLDAIDSTNDYLKQLAREKDMENYTLVLAREQTKGRGQMGAKWYSEPGKNLTMSVLVKQMATGDYTIFDFNVAVALSVVAVLHRLQIPKIQLKWPNDIMAENKKIGGILIENSLKPDGSMVTVVGIGLNVNQTNFENLPQASSLACLTGKTFDVEILATLLVESLQEQLQVEADILWQQYLQNLYKIKLPSAFEDINGHRFMGIIQEVTREGKLALLQEDDLVHYYEVKEIKMLY
ncbi:biotin--[acetyl-CoA-carboxylase] ligase [Flavobacterium sp. XGLA_31]|uniref:biotin--[acetyl-CoA-carboxylase] ligase n=1 Tax=Flavobacterium sp. XGLA_31 TaxID=3447666 RepID=UPI003F3132AB